MSALGRITRGSHNTYYSRMFIIAHAFKGHVHVFAGWVKIVSHSFCMTSAILKYFCPLSIVRRFSCLDFISRIKFCYKHVIWHYNFLWILTIILKRQKQLRNSSALAVNCCIIIHCLEVRCCKEDQITRVQREWFIFVQLTDKQWIITQQFMH